MTRKRWRGSRFAVGSSRRRTTGSPARTRARRTRCRSPPDIAPRSSRASAVASISASAPSAAARSAAPGAPNVPRCRGAAEEDEVQRADREERLEALRKVAERARRLAPRHGGEAPAVKEDLAGTRRQDAREGLQERRLARAVLPEQDGHAAARERERDGPKGPSAGRIPRRARAPRGGRAPSRARPQENQERGGPEERRDGADRDLRRREERPRERVRRDEEDGASEEREEERDVPAREAPRRRAGRGGRRSR